MDGNALVRSQRRRGAILAGIGLLLAAGSFFLAARHEPAPPAYLAASAVLGAVLGLLPSAVTWKSHLSGGLLAGAYVLVVERFYPTLHAWFSDGFWPGISVMISAMLGVMLVREMVSLLKAQSRDLSRSA